MGKTNVSKAPRKGGVSRRKPLGDSSNSVKLTPKQSLKKQKESGASKITFDGSKKKAFDKAPEKQQTSGRKALVTDISKLHEAPKKNVNTKVSVVAEDDLGVAEDDDLDWVAEAGFSKEQCIKIREAQTRGMDFNVPELIQQYAFPNQSASALEMDPVLFGKSKPPSPLWHMEPDPLPWKDVEFSDWKLPNDSMLRRNNEDYNSPLFDISNVTLKPSP